jgi:hypothetical protein
VIIETIDQVRQAFDRAWPLFVAEARSVLGSELHYQAMLYYALRTVGVPVGQVGMNVKQWIEDPISPLFQRLNARKHQDYRGGFEPIPDLVVFSPSVAGDWRRRRRQETLRAMLLAVELKASERHESRLTGSEIRRDIEKLAAHREEAQYRGCEFHPVAIVVDTAPLTPERMQPARVYECATFARELGVEFRYLSCDECIP